MLKAHNCAPSARTRPLGYCHLRFCSLPVRYVCVAAFLARYYLRGSYCSGRLRSPTIADLTIAIQEPTAPSHLVMIYLLSISLLQFITSRFERHVADVYVDQHMNKHLYIHYSSSYLFVRDNHCCNINCALSMRLRFLI